MSFLVRTGPLNTAEASVYWTGAYADGPKNCDRVENWGNESGNVPQNVPDQYTTAIFADERVSETAFIDADGNVVVALRTDRLLQLFAPTHTIDHIS
jgi:hypothetical protein